MEEVLPFLDNERLDVREEAARILSLHSLQEFEFLSKHTDLFTLKLNEEESVSKHILDCLINTSSLIEINSPVLVKKTIDIIKTNSVLAESCCLLINNLNVEIEFLDDLIDILNYNCDKYHHLSGVFTKLSSTNQGSLYLLDRMDRILIYSTHDNFIRRRNSISVLKNICLQNHEPSTLTNLLPFILDPLMGPEEYDLDEMELFPSQLQFLESTKRREPDETLRLMLVESLLLISSFGVKGRDLLRKNGVYFIIRTMHLTEECENVREMIERVVDLLQRDEPREPIREIINDMMIDRRLIPPTLITIYKGTIASKPFFIYSYKTANLREIATIISNNIFPLVSKFTFQLSQKQYSIYASKYSSDDDVRLVETGYVPGDFILIFDESEATPIRKFIGSGANFVPLGKHERVESDFPEKIYDRTQEKSRPSSVEKDSTVKKKKINSEGWGLPFVEPFVEKISEKVEKPKAENAWKPPIEEW